MANVAGLSTQMSAFIALGVDAGPRKGELCGLRWTGVNLDRGKVSIVRQLITPGREPVFAQGTDHVHLRARPTHGEATARRLSGVLYGVRDQSVINQRVRGRIPQQNLGILTIGAEERI